jgi:hypothetical protein
VNGVSVENARSCHERYRQIFNIIQERDREIARIFDDPQRSQAVSMLAQIPEHDAGSLRLDRLRPAQFIARHGAHIGIGVCGSLDLRFRHRP